MLVSDKVKDHLIKRLEECQQKLKKLERKRQVIKTLYIVTILLSIVTSATVTVLSSITIVPIMVVPILSAFGGILTAISARFNFNEKNQK